MTRARRLRRFAGLGAGLTAVLILAGCASVEAPDPSAEGISVPYDPYDYDAAALDAEAQAHCEAYGKRAVHVGDSAPITEVRWRHRNYDCV